MYIQNSTKTHDSMKFNVSKVSLEPKIKKKLYQQNVIRAHARLITSAMLIDKL